MEHKHFKVCHETGMIIFTGMLISLGIYFMARFKASQYQKNPELARWIDNDRSKFSEENYQQIVFMIIKHLEFDTKMFFDVFLPLIIFATGFNMRREKFFENIVNISKFGLLGTLLTFIFYSTFTVMAIKFIPFQVKSYNQDDIDPFRLDLDFIEVLFICSIFCSSDIIAAVTIVKFEEQPTLFSVILGEGLFNDAVAVILYQTMKDVALNFKRDPEKAAEEVIGAGFYLEVIFTFFSLCFLSILVGTICGMIPTYLLKRFRFISHSAIHESTLLLIFAMIGYFMSEVLEISGIVSILCTSLVYSHYAFFNLSPQGKNITSVLFQTLGFIAEGTVFIYLGVSSIFYLWFKPICWPFVFMMMCIVVLGRYMAVYISYYIFSCCPGKKRNLLSFPEVTFISFAALIRGSIAFGLVLKMTSDFRDDSVQHELNHFQYFKDPKNEDGSNSFGNADLFCDPFYKNGTWANTNEHMF